MEMEVKLLEAKAESERDEALDRANAAEIDMVKFELNRDAVIAAHRRTAAQLKATRRLLGLG